MSPSEKTFNPFPTFPHQGKERFTQAPGQTYHAENRAQAYLDVRWVCRWYLLGLAILYGV